MKRILIALLLTALAVAGFTAFACGEDYTSPPSSYVVREHTIHGARCSREFFWGPFEDHDDAVAYVEKRQRQDAKKRREPGHAAPEYVVYAVRGVKR